jgi:parallel beta-helix repeat protein
LPEVVFIDDQPLVQIRSKRDLASGRFYLDRKAGNLYLKDDPTGRKVEITVAAIAFESEASNILIKNLTVEKYASVAQIGAINGQRATGWSIENCEVRLNSSAGISLGADGRVRVCNIHHNGQLGVGGVGHNILLEQNEVWANNTRGFSYRWEAGGVKIALSDGVVFRDNHVHDNVGPGLWCDINCRDVLYENNTVERNSGTGIFHEISFKATIRNNIVRNNGLADDWQWVWGNDILIAASQDVDVHDNTVVVSPGKCGIVMIDQSRPIEGPMKGGGKYKTRNNRVHDNNITFLGAPCAGGASDVMPGDENYSIISSGNNVFDRNVYRVPSPIDQPWFFWEHSMLDWDSLKLKGLERDGRFEVY